MLFDYNSLNLLSEVRRDGQPAAKYDWLVDGTKLGVCDGSGTAGFEYVGSLIYRKSNSGLHLGEALFGDGVIRVNDNGTQEVDYFLTDHLGSVRVIVDAAGAVKERNDYYPFGARHVRSDYALSTNRWKYNGKELQTTGDLGFLDYGARMYDMSVGRWFGMDPLAEEYTGLSGYVFCDNNPLIFVDDDGQYFDWYQNAAGTAMLWKDSKEEELLINGEVYNNVGSSMSLEVDGLYFNYYQNTLASTSSEPLSGMESVLSNPSLLSKLLGSNSMISEMSQLELLVRSMHNAQDAFLNHPITQTTSNTLILVATGGIEGFAAIGSLGKNILNKCVYQCTTSDGFLFGGITIKTPFNIPVQRFGQMRTFTPDFWGMRIGSNSFVNRTFAAIKPEWNNLTQYTTGIIPKGTSVRFGIIGPQGLKYPGGSLQFILDSRNVINQTSKLIIR